MSTGLVLLAGVAITLGATWLVLLLVLVWRGDL